MDIKKQQQLINPLECRYNYSATSNNSWYTGRLWVGCYIWYSEEGTGRDGDAVRPCPSSLYQM